MDSKFWDEYAKAGYDRLMKFPPYTELVSRVSNEVIKPGRKGRKVAELGSGTGNTSIAIAQAGADVTGFEFSDEMIRIAEAKAERLGVKNVRFQKADLSKGIPAEGGAFGTVVTLNALYAMENPDYVLSEARRVLAPEGWYVAAEFQMPFGSRFVYGMIREQVGEYGLVKGMRNCAKLLPILSVNRRIGKGQRKRIAHYWKPEDFAQMLRNSGFILSGMVDAYAGGADTLSASVKASPFDTREFGPRIFRADSSEDVKRAKRFREEQTGRRNLSGPYDSFSTQYIVEGEDGSIRAEMQAMPLIPGGRSNIFDYNIPTRSSTGFEYVVKNYKQSQPGPSTPLILRHAVDAHYRTIGTDDFGVRATIAGGHVFP